VACLLSTPHATRLLPAEHVARFTQLWQEREQFLTTLGRVPLTFCHNDVHLRNVFVRGTASGDDESLVIDWEDAGPAAIGEELAILVTSRLTGEKTAPAERDAIDAVAFAAYVEGLRALGWQGDPRLVRFAYATRAALREAVAIRWLVQGVAGGRLSPEFLASAYACAPDEAIARHAQVLAFILDLADEARDLLPLL
jgi:Ser/Thr protein kinase RdoA (MazF antagonist)